jgi:hypothetical protein
MERKEKLLKLEQRIGCTTVIVALVVTAMSSSRVSASVWENALKVSFWGGVLWLISWMWRAQSLYTQDRYRFDVFARLQEAFEAGSIPKLAKLLKATEESGREAKWKNLRKTLPNPKFIVEPKAFVVIQHDTISVEEPSLREYVSKAVVRYESKIVLGAYEETSLVVVTPATVRSVAPIPLCPSLQDIAQWSDTEDFCTLAFRTRKYHEQYDIHKIPEGEFFFWFVVGCHKSELKWELCVSFTEHSGGRALDPQDKLQKTSVQYWMSIVTRAWSDALVEVMTPSPVSNGLVSPDEVERRLGEAGKTLSPAPSPPALGRTPSSGDDIQNLIDARVTK